MTRFQDIADNSEDRRIDIIASHVERGEIVAFVTDDDPGKPERYIRKLQLRVRDLEVVAKFAGPVANTVVVKVQKKPKPVGGS